MLACGCDCCGSAAKRWRRVQLGCGAVEVHRVLCGVVRWQAHALGCCLRRRARAHLRRKASGAEQSPGGRAAKGEERAPESEANAWGPERAPGGRKAMAKLDGEDCSGV